MLFVCFFSFIQIHNRQFCKQIVASDMVLYCLLASCPIKRTLDLVIMRANQISICLGPHVRSQIFLIMILTFQRWIICAHKQVPWDMDVFCLRTQIFL